MLCHQCNAALQPHGAVPSQSVASPKNRPVCPTPTGAPLPQTSHQPSTWFSGTARAHDQTLTLAQHTIENRQNDGGRDKHGRVKWTLHKSGI